MLQNCKSQLEVLALSKATHEKVKAFIEETIIDCSVYTYHCFTMINLSFSEWNQNILKKSYIQNNAGLFYLMHIGKSIDF